MAELRTNWPRLLPGSPDFLHTALRERAPRNCRLRTRRGRRDRSDKNNCTPICVCSHIGWLPKTRSELLKRSPVLAFSGFLHRESKHRKVLLRSVYVTCKLFLEVRNSQLLKYIAKDGGTRFTYFIISWVPTDVRHVNDIPKICKTTRKRYTYLEWVQNALFDKW